MLYDTILYFRQRLDSRAAALEELLLGEVGSPPDTTPSPMSERMKFNTHAVEVTPQPLSISYETKTLPTSKSQEMVDFLKMYPQSHQAKALGKASPQRNPEPSLKPTIILTLNLWFKFFHG